MSISPEAAPSDVSGLATGHAHEALACVSCRTRKLKCDRLKPVCTRCSRAGADCVYPESRRKPAFKRKNVRELEERLAQVEGLLKSVSNQRDGQASGSSASRAEASSPKAHGEGTSHSQGFQRSPMQGAVPWSPFSTAAHTPSTSDNSPQGELLGLGQFETLPPFEMIEELHKIFLATQQHFMPIIHPGNYMRAFHAPPHMRPPMGLQYAIWTLASNGHSKYGCYHDALYARARQYLEADELKGYGEHFITIGHAQAWALLATDEARCLLFTRAAMSTARCVRLVGMMGLHRLDSTLSEDDIPMAPMITPSKSWVELEERRRLFWGAFCIDSYASISTGWPNMIDPNQITTHLPVSEKAFVSGVEEPSSTLHNVFRGSNYSTFAGNVVICFLFNQLLKHAHRPMPDDRPEDADFGPFWKRHRELDNMLSSAFMFLPEPFRLPANIRDPIAVQANLNLHASVICLHNAACEKADKFKLPGIKQKSRTRALTAAQEIVDIIKLTSHTKKSGYVSPLMALSLYCAASVYILHAKENPEEHDNANLELIVKCMEAIGRQQTITRAYLNQVLLDIERNGLSVSLGISPSRGEETRCGHGIPLVARGATSRHTQLQSPLPGRLPLGAPRGVMSLVPGATRPVPCAPFVGPYPRTEDVDTHASKRKRTDAPSGEEGVSTSMGGPGSTSDPSMWSGGQASSRSTLEDDSAAALFGQLGGTSWSYSTRFSTTTTLPHRTGSPAMNNPIMSDATSNTIPGLGSYPFMSMAGAGMEGPGTSFPEMPVPSTSSTAGTSFARNTNTDDNNNNNNNNTNATISDEVPSIGDMFQALGAWGGIDPEVFYEMLVGGALPGSSNTADDFATSQDSMDTWVPDASSAGGSSWNSRGGAGGASGSGSG